MLGGSTSRRGVDEVDDPSRPLLGRQHSSFGVSPLELEATLVTQTCRDVVVPVFETRGCLAVYTFLAVLSAFLLIWEFLFRANAAPEVEEVRFVLDAFVNVTLFAEIVIGLSAFHCHWLSHWYNAFIVIITLLCCTWMVCDSIDYNEHMDQGTHKRRPWLFNHLWVRTTVFCMLYGSRCLILLFRASIISAFFNQDDVHAEFGIEQVASEEPDVLLRSYLTEEPDALDREPSTRYRLPSYEDAYEHYYQGGPASEWS
jgi:hypothetical protein